MTALDEHVGGSDPVPVSSEADDGAVVADGHNDLRGRHGEAPREAAYEVELVQSFSDRTNQARGLRKRR